MTLWFDRKHRHAPWSIHKNIAQIDQYLLRYKYPSNTSRMPRSIVKFNLFKGSEFRALLLFGFLSFKPFLPAKYFNHLILLVIGTHFVEARSIDQSHVQLIRMLFEQFLRLFPTLYTERQNVQCVHSLHHFADSVNSCGSSSNYSTFNFESFLGRYLDAYFFIRFFSIDLGILTGSIHSTRRHGIEIENNIRMLRSACIATEAPDFNASLSNFLDGIQMGKRVKLTDTRSNGTQAPITVHHHHNDPIKLRELQQTLNNKNIELFRTCYVRLDRQLREASLFMFFCHR